MVAFAAGARPWQRHKQGDAGQMTRGAWKYCAALSAEHIDKWRGSAFTNPSASCCRSSPVPAPATSCPFSRH